MGSLVSIASGTLRGNLEGRRGFGVLLTSGFRAVLSEIEIPSVLARSPLTNWFKISSTIFALEKISVGKNLDGRLEIFATDFDGLLYHKWQSVTGGDNSWTEWAHGGTIQGFA